MIQICRIIWLLAASTILAADVPLILLTDLKAKCLDGTQAGFYTQTASNITDRDKWVITLDGGGECDTEKACRAKLHTALGSSNYFSNSTVTKSWFLGSNNCKTNPDFCEWNHVRNPYCTQDFHSGQVVEATNATWGLYFSGHLVLRALLEWLDKPPYNLQNATEIIVQGISAGGIGLWTVLDYVAHRYPSARVTGISIAGFNNYAFNYKGPNATSAGWLTDFHKVALPRAYALYDAYVDQTCKRAYEARGLSPAACLLSNNSFPFIESEVFVVQSQTDSVSLTRHDALPDKYKDGIEEQAFMHQFRKNMAVSLAPLMKADNLRNGVFAAACYMHTAFDHARPLIKNISYLQAFGNFYFKRTAPELYKLSDDCGLMCNPTCSPIS